jgi:hypothetical protein
MSTGALGRSAAADPRRRSEHPGGRRGKDEGVDIVVEALDGADARIEVSATPSRRHTVSQRPRLISAAAAR